VDDLVEGLIRLMNAGPDFHGPVNLGNPGEFTIAELAEKVIALADSRSTITRLPLPADDPRQRQPDISLARRQLRWAPTIQLDEGLAQTITYFRGIVAQIGPARIGEVDKGKGHYTKLQS
jgi:UDP-glucuronate decarboxylase